MICACGKRDLVNLTRFARGALKTLMFRLFVLNHFTSFVPMQKIILSTLATDRGLSLQKASTSLVTSLMLAPEFEQLITVRDPLLMRAPSTRSVIDVPKMTQIFSSLFGAVRAELLSRE